MKKKNNNDRECETNGKGDPGNDTDLLFPLCNAHPYSNTAWNASTIHPIVIRLYRCARTNILFLHGFNSLFVSVSLKRKCILLLCPMNIIIIYVISGYGIRTLFTRERQASSTLYTCFRVLMQIPHLGV